jgi:DNA-binding MarR family transcriptional regulator
MPVDRLEAAGWVRRTPHPRDRRSTLVELSGQVPERTPPGLAAYHARVRSIAAKVRTEHREAIGDFLQAAAGLVSAAARDLRDYDPPGRPGPARAAPSGRK